ncbi:hypothetical protein [Streptomyces virginiae]|uniref:hypothetical protein n=1 Tax=Streptomyces virginiae TaxID=1961 RepID=UPI0038644E4E|nr:hypothetical protein OG253_40280 [Streptomyces virginiae]
MAQLEMAGAPEGSAPTPMEVVGPAASTSELLSLLALNSTPTCEEAFKKAQADGTHPA